MKDIAYANKLIDLREKAGKSLRTAAKELNISYSALSYYESGKRKPRDDVKERIAAYYKTTVGSIFFNE